MLFLAFALMLSPAHVDVYHGARHEIVFTEGATVTVKRPAPTCETFGPRIWDGSYVTVCAGHVVEVTSCKPDAAISAAAEARVNALRAKLAAGDDHGTVRL